MADNVYDLAEFRTEALTTNVRTDTANEPPNEASSDPLECTYTEQERVQVDEANAALLPIINAVEKIEDIEQWVPPLVRGVRALRDRAMRETGALKHFDGRYRTRFTDLLNAELIGPWLLDTTRRSILSAIHYLGEEDTYLDAFLDWRRTKITEKEREKWRCVRTLVDHFKEWQGKKVRKKKSPRSANQKVIETIRTEGHRADAARQAEVDHARQELATHTIETTDTFWAVLLRAGPEMLARTIKEHGDKIYAGAVYEALGVWLKEPTA